MLRPKTAPERIRAADGEATDFTRVSYITPPIPVTAPDSRSSSPGLLPIRFTTQNRDPDSMFTTSRPGRVSTLKGSSKTKTSLSSSLLPQADTAGETDSDPVKMGSNAGSTSFSTYDRVRSSSTDRIGGSYKTRKNRGSLLVAATDVFNFRFGRKRPIIRPPPPLPIILPDVIEISAPPPDQEVEERNRLREMAAQAIGISPYMGQPDSHSQDSTEDDEDQDVLRTPVDTSELRRFGDARNSESAPDFTNKNISVDTNLSSVPPSLSNSSRLRSGSMVHARANSMSFSPIPPFPTNLLSLNPWSTCSGYIPKYTQPSSMRIFALSSKNWKNRYIIFTSPANIVSIGHTTPATSYLHVFKSSGPDEKELERLEINENSVIFVAEEEVGSRRSVIKVGGLSVSEGRPDGLPEGTQQTMWHLQITDASESQRWISSIKNAILGQRTVRAGLVVPSTPGGFEPRGDLDVMLSIRAQGLATALQATTFPLGMDPVSPTSPTDPHYASSISSRSIRSQTTSPKIAPSGAVSAFKGLFSNRPRSTSRATNASVDVERQLDKEKLDGSLSASLSNRTKLRSNSVVETRTNYASPLGNPVQPRGAFSSNSSSPDHSIERKVLAERNNEWNDQTIRVITHKENRANRSLSLSLQPPPRKRWNNAQRPMSTNPSDEIRFTYVNRDPSATTVFPPRHSNESESSTNPVDFTSFSFPHRNEDRPPSLHSVSTHDSEKAMSVDRSTVSTKRSSGTANRRWSRTLPQRSTPPSGPPPAIPAASSVTKLHVHPYGIDSGRPPSTTSTMSSAQSHNSMVSTLPTFSKRTSSSSSSISSGNMTPTSPVRSSHRHSMPPPPRPPPTSTLPPAPIHPDDNPMAPPLPTPPATKTSFRNSVAQRAMRLSMMAPKPPPSTNLPPRPDEAEVTSKSTKTHHRRSSSSGRSQILSTILEPVKNRDHHSTSNPHPPPAGPLPPPPNQGSSTPNSGPTPPVSRHSSLKQRLRILSAPSPINSTAPLPPPSRLSNPNPSTTPIVPYFTNSTPSTPMGDKLAFISSNDYTSSFLQMSTPTLSSVPPSRIFEEALIDDQAEAVELLDHVTSLSPPPRRHSKPLIESLIPNPETDPNQIAALCSAFQMPATNDDDETHVNVNTSVNTNDEESDPKTPRMFSLSPPGSVASLPLVNL